MALAFPNSSRSFDARRRAICFWGYDSAFEIAFYVDAEVMYRLSPQCTNDEASLLHTFDVHRARIEAAAGAIYARGRQSFCRLVPSDF